LRIKEQETRLNLHEHDDDDDDDDDDDEMCTALYLTENARFLDKCFPSISYAQNRLFFVIVCTR